jgi:hypothetical protein
VPKIAGGFPSSSVKPMSSCSSCCPSSTEHLCLFRGTTMVVNGRYFPAVLYPTPSSSKYKRCFFVTGFCALYVLSQPPLTLTNFATIQTLQRHVVVVVVVVVTDGRYQILHTMPRLALLCKEEDQN